MDIGYLLGIGGSVATIVALGVTLNVPRHCREMYRTVKARIEAPRKRREALEQTAEALQQAVEAQEKKLELTYGLVRHLMESEDSQLKFHDFTLKGTESLQRQVDALTAQLSEARDQIAELRTQAMSMLTSTADVLSEFRRADEGLREAVEKLEQMIATLQEQLNKSAKDAGGTRKYLQATADKLIEEMDARDELEKRVQALEHEVRENLGVLGEAVRMAQEPAGARVEQLAKNYANGPIDPHASDAPRGR